MNKSPLSFRTLPLPLIIMDSTALAMCKHSDRNPGDEERASEALKDQCL